MAYTPNPHQRSGGQGRGPGMPMPAPSEVLKQFKQSLAAGASFGDEQIMGLAETLAADLEGGFKNESGRTQVRKVYGEVRALLEKGKGGFDAIRPELRLIQAHVAYAVGRGTITPQFKEFADEAVKRLIAASQKEELDRFVKFFEALYAHFYYFSKCGRKEG